MNNPLTSFFSNKKYDLVYADPAWQLQKSNYRKSRPNQKKELDYKTIDLDQIKNILSNFDANILFMWTIDKYLFQAEEIGKQLGYNLHARIIWDKENGIAPAFTIRFSHEYLLWFFKTGKLTEIDKNMRGKFTTVIREKSTKHSKKPIKAYEMIEALYPNHSKIELFARNRRNGWDAWGNEIE